MFCLDHSLFRRDFFTGLWKQKYETVKLSRFSSPVPLLRDCIESSLTTLNSVF